MAIIKKARNMKCWGRCGEKETIIYYWWECKLVKPLWKAIWRFLKKLGIELPHDPAITLLDIYLKITKTPIQKDICTPMLITALFTIAKIWKQPKCPWTDEWIKNRCDIYISHICVCVCVCIYIYIYIYIHTYTHNGILLRHKKR